MEMFAQFLTILFGVWLMAVGIFMLVSPQTAIRYIGKAASTNFINYSELTLRGIWGVALVLSAESSKFPEIFQIFGMVLIVTTAILFFIPRKWHARYAVWCSNNLTVSFTRVVAPVSLVLGIFLIYAII